MQVVFYEVVRHQNALSYRYVYFVVLADVGLDSSFSHMRNILIINGLCSNINLLSFVIMSEFSILPFDYLKKT